MNGDFAKLHSSSTSNLVEYRHGATTEWIAFPKPKLAEAAHEAISMLIDDETPVTVAEFVARYVRLHVMVRISSAATHTYLRFADELVRSFGSRELRDITIVDVEDYIRAERATGHKDAQITPVLKVWSSIFSTAKKWRYVNDNPVSRVGGLLLGSSPQ